MKHKPRSRFHRKKTRTILRLPDLEHAKEIVLNSLSSAEAQRGYKHAIDEFVDWYCSEPALRSTGPRSCCIALILKTGNWLPAPSTFVSVPSSRLLIGISRCGLACTRQVFHGFIHRYLRHQIVLCH